ncbi:hypothetical protein J4206_01715 [Candidatus Woesearchaeota archaeon]|nr:hypothetical protein [Candidatus Woesearchaeota archaeon]
MAVLMDLLFTIVMIPISTFILHAVAAKYELRHVRMDTAFLVATAVEFVNFALRYMVRFDYFREIITLLAVMGVGFWLIKFYFHDSWKVALEIWCVWFVLRLLTNLLLAVVPGVIIAFST